MSQFDQAKPQTYLDMPKNFHWAAVDRPDRDNPVGVKGIAEPIMGAGRVGVAQRHRRRARRTILPPHPGGPRHDHQCACQASAVLSGRCRPTRCDEGALP